MRKYFYHTVPVHKIIRNTGVSLFLLLVYSFSSAQTSATQFIINPPDDDGSIDDIILTLNIRQLGSFEISAMIQDQKLFLPCKELFDILKLKVDQPYDPELVKGFILNQNDVYTIDYNQKRIEYKSRVFQLAATDFIKSPTDLYLRSSFYGEIFGLDCKFDFRSLTITLNTDLELPVIREMQREKFRQNLRELKGEKKADTIVAQQYPFFSLGSLDWFVLSTKGNPEQEGNKLYLNFGGVVAGGEANVVLNYDKSGSYNHSQQLYRWRLVNNNFAPLRQLVLGNVSTRSTASLYSPVNGIQLTNAPTTFRRSFGSYRLSDHTEPDWLVELYVNNVLVNYTKADASGFFSFDVPLMYGSTMVKLRFYGPWGEERVQERNISVPFNFLPSKEFEYTLTAGIVDDGNNSKFSRGSLNYGLSNRLTIGGGAEYLSSVDPKNAMPFINASYRISSNMLLSAEHNFDVQSKAILRYQLPAGMQMELNYVKYQKDQKAITVGKGIPANYNEEKRVSIFMPLRSKKLAGFARFNYNETGYYNYHYTMADLMLSADTRAFGTNLTTSAVYSDPKQALIFSTLAMNFRLPHRMRVMPQARFEYRQASFNLLRVDVEKGVFRNGFLNASYGKDMQLRNTNISVGFRYTFSFAQASLAYLRNAGKNTYMQSARGTVLFNDKTNHLHFDQQSGTGRGGLVIMPFLDINDNNIWDKGEPKVEGLRVRVNGGKINVNKKDTSIEVNSLEAYAPYLIELDNTGLDNIAWQLNKKNIQVTVEANHYKKIEVPVRVMAEVSGKVLIRENNQEKGQGKIIINIYRDFVLVASTLSEADGFFSYMGLTPGRYTIKTDEQQLQKIRMKSSKELPITILPNADGPVVGGLMFTLEPTKGEGRMKTMDE